MTSRRWALRAAGSIYFLLSIAFALEGAWWLALFFAGFGAAAAYFAATEQETP